MTTINPVFLEQTAILDFKHPSITTLVADHKWQAMSEYDAIGAIYNYVRDTILFGYNLDDTIKASEVLRDGYGQCNTKGTLLMALLRAIGIPCRLHGFTIHNELQRGAIPNYLFRLAPKKIIHSWVEVFTNGQWLNLEGYIIDKAYLHMVQQSIRLQNSQLKPHSKQVAGVQSDSFQKNSFQGISEQCQAYSGYGIATKCIAAPNIDWHGSNTYIQREGIADDFGIFNHPDEFYSRFGSNLSGMKKWLFRYVVRHLINANVKRIRQQGFMLKET